MRCARPRLLGGVLFLLAAGTACERAGGPAKLGLVAPLSGPAAAVGASTRKGCELAVRECNQEGGLNGRACHLTVLDDRGDPQQAVTAVTRLVTRDKVAALVGPPLSPVALAVAPLAQAGGVPLVSPSATHPRLTDAGGYVFRACFTDAAQGAAAARFAHMGLKARRAVCLFDAQDEATRMLAEAFRDTFEGLGGRVPGFLGLAQGPAGAAAGLTRLLATRPDLVYLPDPFGAPAVLVRQARAAGFQGPVLGSDRWTGQAPPGLANCFYTNHVDLRADDPMVQRFVVRFRAAFGHDPDTQAALAYDAAWVTLEALRTAAGPDGRSVRDALARLHWQGVTGRLAFDEHRDPRKPVVILEVQGGQPVGRY